MKATQKNLCNDCRQTYPFSITINKKVIAWGADKKTGILIQLSWPIIKALQSPKVTIKTVVAHALSIFEEVQALKSNGHKSGGK